MKSLISCAAAALLLATSAWAQDDHTHDKSQKHTHASAPTTAVNAQLDAHTREDIARHRGMARAHQEAAQCLEQGGAYEVCQKQLQSSCKGLALGKNCGMRHSH